MEKSVFVPRNDCFATGRNRGDNLQIVLKIRPVQGKCVWIRSLSIVMI